MSPPSASGQASAPGPARGGGLAGKLIAALALLFVIVWVTPLRQTFFGADGGATTESEDAPRRAAMAVGSEASELDKAGRHAESAQRYARAAELAEAAGETELARNYRAQRGVCLKLAGQVAEAGEVLTAALAESRAAQDRRTEGLALGNLARVAVLQGDPRGAYERLVELVEVARALQDTLLAVRTLEQVAIAALELNEVEECLEHIDQALAADPDLDPADSRRSALLGLRASALVQLGDDEGAEAQRAALPATPAVLANAALHKLLLEDPLGAADLALAAFEGFRSEGELRREERDRALQVYLDALLQAGERAPVATRLEALRDAGGAQALAPFQVIAARLARLENRLEDAEAEALAALAGLDEARAEAEAPDAAFGGRRRADPTRSLRDVTLLLATVQIQAEAYERAADTLAAAPACLAREFLLAWLAGVSPPGDRLATEAAAGFDPETWNPQDDSLTNLALLCDGLLPGWGYVALAAGLADLRRMEETGRGDFGRVILRQAAARALRWQALQTLTRVPDLLPSAEDRAEHARWASGWVDRRRATEGAPAAREEQDALVVLLPGLADALLLLSTHEHPATTYHLPLMSHVERSVDVVVGLLRGNDPRAVAAGSHELYRAVLPPGARADLAHALRWTLILPDRVLAVPPGLWCERELGGSAAVRWLLEDRELVLAPHAPGARRDESGRLADWLVFATPSVQPEGVPLVFARWRQRFGAAVFDVQHATPLEGSIALVEEHAHAAALHEAVGVAAGLRLTVPGSSGSRLGGVLLAPSPQTAGLQHGEAAGFVSWHRLAQLPLPPTVVCDSQRFDPTDANGPVYAATALGAAARRVLLVRWPQPEELREAQVQDVIRRVRESDGTLTLGAAVAAMQREWLALSRRTGGEPLPRTWGAWLAFG